MEFGKLPDELPDSEGNCRLCGHSPESHSVFGFCSDCHFELEEGVGSGACAT